MHVRHLRGVTNTVAWVTLSCGRLTQWRGRDVTCANPDEHRHIDQCGIRAIGDSIAVAQLVRVALPNTGASVRSG